MKLALAVASVNLSRVH